MKHRFTLDELRTWDDRKIIQTLIHRLRSISDNLGDCGSHFPSWENGQLYGVLMTDYRKGKKLGYMPALKPDTVVSCGGLDWRGDLESAGRDGRELRCPKCGNFIFAFTDLAVAPDFTFRVMEKG